MDELLNKIKSADFLPAPDSAILAAVSGGADSVAMLLLLNALAPEYRWRLTVGHINHGLRGQAGADEQFVQELAGRLNLRFLSKKVQVDFNKQAPEEAARLARHKGLRQLAAEAGGRLIALAHNADDQAETLLMRMLTGSGPSGLAGMRALNPPWWRPLLGARGLKLRAFLTTCAQPWQEDHTNREDRFMRNRLRHHLMPLIEGLINGQAVAAITRLADLCALEEDYWHGWCLEQQPAGLQNDGAHWLIIPQPFWHEAQLRRFIRHALNIIYGKGQHLLAVHMEQLLRLWRGPNGKHIPLPQGRRAWKEKGRLAISRDSEERAPQAICLHGPASFCLDGTWQHMQIQDKGPQLIDHQQVWLPVSAIAWPLVLHTPLPGQKFHYLHGLGQRKISWLLQDLQVPRRRRGRVLLLSDQKGPWWLLGLKASQRLRPYLESYGGQWIKIGRPAGQAEKFYKNITHYKVLY